MPLRPFDGFVGTLIAFERFDFEELIDRLRQDILPWRVYVQAFLEFSYDRLHATFV